jgi:hypothetical protein
VSVGSAADAHPPSNSYDDLPPTHVARRRPPKTVPTRILSCFRRGFIKTIVALLKAQPLAIAFGTAPWAIACFFPQPWSNQNQFSSA